MKNHMKKEVSQVELGYIIVDLRPELGHINCQILLHILFLNRFFKVVMPLKNSERIKISILP